MLISGAFALLLFFLAGSEAEDCTDRSINCKEFIANCHGPPVWKDYMEKNCARTCGKCSTGTGGNKGKCGISTVKQGRIISGTNARKGAWPWIVSLTHPKHDSSNFCGASLIAPKWVLTASHCVKGKSPRQIQAIVGQHNLKTKEQSEQKLSVEQIILHPQFGKLGLQHDIALLKLTQPASFNNYVQPACLPSKEETLPVGTKCYLAGWGSVNFPGPPPPILQQAILPVVTGNKCTSISGFICTGYGRTSTINACTGDSGGPLVCQTSDGKWVQHGVTSFVVEYCKRYTAFTKVSDYIDWIQQYTGRY